MELIKTIKIPTPPTKYVHRLKNKIDPKTGKLKETTYYLTANLFFQGNNPFLIRKIVQSVKRYLMEYLVDIPKMSKMRVELIYQKDKDNFDLDNKCYFWAKLILDILKTPSSRQVTNANKKGREIITTKTIKDDTVKYLDKITMAYQRGEHCLILNIYGKKQEDELTLF